MMIDRFMVNGKVDLDKLRDELAVGEWHDFSKKPWTMGTDRSDQRLVAAYGRYLIYEDGTYFEYPKASS